MDRNWRDRAACLTADPNLFIAADNQRQTVTEANEQYAIQEYCNRCPVRRACRENAEELRSEGVAGGLTESERRRQRVNRRTREARAQKGHQE
jgi:WhiB family redox-sensing transcriptional regulator